MFVAHHLNEYKGSADGFVARFAPFSANVKDTAAAFALHKQAQMTSGTIVVSEAEPDAAAAGGAGGADADADADDDDVDDDGYDDDDAAAAADDDAKAAPELSQADIKRLIAQLSPGFPDAAFVISPANLEADKPGEARKDLIYTIFAITRIAGAGHPAGGALEGATSQRAPAGSGRSVYEQ